jgi:protein TonB
MSSYAMAGVTPSDRLGLTLFLAAALHATVILGVSFAPTDRPDREALPTLDVILVQSNSRKPPEEADFLAQANQDGGGTAEEKARPRAPVSAPTPVDRQGVAPIRQETASKPKKPRQSPKPITVAKAEVKQPTPPKEPEPRSKPKPKTADIVSRSLEIARLQAEVNDAIETYAKRPRVLALSARTKEAVEASYLEAWVRKVERIGNLNYPEEARRRNLSGTLRLNVRLDAEGRVVNMMVSLSSGHPVLDEAAKHIVDLASPFAPFPKALRKKTDHIMIVRTWEFSSGNRLSSRE